MTAGDEFGEVESVKAVSSLFSPVDGTVTEVNTSLPDRWKRSEKILTAAAGSLRSESATKAAYPSYSTTTRTRNSALKKGELGGQAGSLFVALLVCVSLAITLTESRLPSRWARRSCLESWRLDPVLS